jgi:hypothetical protein
MWRSLLPVILSILPLLPWHPAEAKNTYTLADLEVLAQEGGHDEFFKHALDIRPSERQEAWREMVSRMADSLTRNILSKSEIPTAQFELIESIHRWPALKADTTFKLRRQEIGLKYLSKCLKDKLRPCWEKFKGFWEADRHDSDTAVRLAELSLSIGNSPFPVWPMLEHALKSPLSEFYCKKDFVLSALWSKLELDYAGLGVSADLLVKIDESVHHDCLPALNQEAKKRLKHPETALDRELAFQILKAQGKANAELIDLFMVMYLLERPSQGELFNHAWNRLNELGKSFQRREKVLQVIKKLDPLPDELISSMDELKKKVVLSHFKANFPEYLDHYFGTCLNYYGGKVLFPSGNPAVNCSKLMDSSLAPEIMGDERIRQFQEIKKI